MRCLFRLITLFVISLTFQAFGADALVFKKDRTAYVESAFEAVKILVPVLIGSDRVADADKETQAFLESLRQVLENSNPHLVFVEGQDQEFLIPPSTTPRLMRSPEDQREIFVNQDRINSDQFRLNYLQLIKLIFHEISHKTKLYTVDRRDQLLQNVELLLKDHYFTVKEPGAPVLEVLSLDEDMIQYPIEQSSYRIQPTFWVYAHYADKIRDLTPDLVHFLNEKSILNRTIGTEIVAAMTELISSLFVPLLKKISVPMDLMAGMFAEPGKKVEGMGSALEKLKGPMKALYLLKIKKASVSAQEITLETTQSFSRSHKNKANFNITGFPFQETESFNTQIKLPLGAGAKNLEPSSQFSPVINFETKAEVKSQIRQGDQLQTVKVIFPYKDHPYTVDLVLQYRGGSIRLNASEREELGKGLYSATFQFTDREYLKTTFADRIIIDDEQVTFLNQRIEIQKESVPALVINGEDVLAESIGIWGFKGMDEHLEKTFSHLKKAVLFFMPMEKPAFVVNPYSFWIQFEVREDVDVSQAELFFKRDQVILKNVRPEKVLTINEPVEGKERLVRYTTSEGTLVSTKTMRESLLFTSKTMKVVAGSRPGYKTIKMHTITPIKHERDLQNPEEAYVVPTFTPLSLRIVDKSLRSFTHAFSSTETTAFMDTEFRRGCDEFLKEVDRKMGR